MRVLPAMLPAAFALAVAAGCVGGNSGGSAIPRETPDGHAPGEATALPQHTEAAPASTEEPEFRPATAAEVSALPGDFATGVHWIDEVIQILVDGRVEELLDSVVWESHECVVDWDRGPPSPPQCPMGLAEGTPVDSIAFVTGETEYVTRGRLGEHLDHAFASPRHLCEVRTPAQTSDGVATVRLRAAELGSDGAVVSDLSVRLAPEGILAIAQPADPVPLDAVVCRN